MQFTVEIWYFVLFVLLSSIQTVSAGGEIVFDSSQGELYSIHSPALDGMSILASHLRSSEHGSHSVDENTAALTDILPHLPYNASVVVLGSTQYGKYSPETFEAIDAYLQRGGSVLVVTNHDDIHEVTSYQNSLTSRYDLTAVTKSHDDWHEFVNCTSSIASGVQAYTPVELLPNHLWTTLLSVPGPHALGTDHAHDSSLPIAAMRHVGEGRLAVLGDTELLWNFIPPLGMNHLPNVNFVSKMLSLLMPADTERSDYVPIASVKGDTNVLAVVETCGSFTPDDGTLGFGSLLKELEEANIKLSFIRSNPIPTTKIKSFAGAIMFGSTGTSCTEDDHRFLNKFKKVIVLSAGYGEPLKEREAADAISELVGRLQRPKPHGLNPFLQEYGISLRSGVLLSSSNTNPFLTTIQSTEGSTNVCMRCGPIEVEPSENVKVLLRADATTTFILEIFSPFQPTSTSAVPPTPPMKPPKKMPNKAFPVMVSADKVLVATHWIGMHNFGVTDRKKFVQQIQSFLQITPSNSEL